MNYPYNVWAIRELPVQYLGQFENCPYRDWSFREEQILLLSVLYRRPNKKICDYLLVGNVALKIFVAFKNTFQI